MTAAPFRSGHRLHPLVVGAVRAHHRGPGGLRVRERGHRRRGRGREAAGPPPMAGPDRGGGGPDWLAGAGGAGGWASYSCPDRAGLAGADARRDRDGGLALAEPRGAVGGAAAAVVGGSGGRRSCNRRPRRTGRSWGCRSGGRAHRRRRGRAGPAARATCAGPGCAARRWQGRPAAGGRMRMPQMSQKSSLAESCPLGHTAIAASSPVTSSPGPSWSTGCRGPSRPRPRPSSSAGPCRTPRRPRLPPWPAAWRCPRCLTGGPALPPGRAWPSRSPRRPACGPPGPPGWRRRARPGQCSAPPAR